MAAADWRVVEIAGSSVGDSSPATLRFESNRHVSGSTGCNQFTGTASIAAEKLSFGPLATTRRACEADRMAEEQSFLKALESVRSFSIDEGGYLRLLGADGNPLLRLTRTNP
ncbi:MAG TPA: META domain-containing protein [Candidatus Eisenbacteria bacterium]|jgi:heat shock protein HslJ